MTHCSAMWSNVRKHGTLLSNNIALVKDPEIRVGHSIENSLPRGILAIKLKKKLTKLWFREATDKTITTESLSIIQRTQPKEPTPTTLFKSGRIRKCRSKPSRISESAFNFYVNKRITYLLSTLVNIKSARETFYNKLIQNTSLPTNYNFTFIITEINKEIEYYTQQRYPITYASKDKRKLQTPAVTSQRIQPHMWKKTKVESPINPSYHYTPESTINITSTGASTATMTSAFGKFPFQSKQKKEDLLRPYGKYFEGFKSRSLLPEVFGLFS
ncbi:hypothetical protein G9A89_014912 [Geosiphon pyriformis]|nr:hypothetical protein G9A89_014912 [Geosiphon pyriformis]